MRALGQRRLAESAGAAPARRSVNPMVVGDATVPRVHAPPADAADLASRLAALRAKLPGAIIDRYLGKVPSVAPDALVCAGAAIIGDVTLAEGTSVWYNAVLRVDKGCTSAPIIATALLLALQNRPNWRHPRRCSLTGAHQYTQPTP